MLSYISRCLSVACECNSGTCIVYKTNAQLCRTDCVVKASTVCNIGRQAEFQHKKSNNLYVTKIYVSLDGVLPP